MLVQGLTTGSVVAVLKFSFFYINFFVCVSTVFLDIGMCFHCCNCHDCDVYIRLEVAVRISFNASFVVYSYVLCKYYFAENFRICLIGHLNVHCIFNNTFLYLQSTPRPEGETFVSPSVLVLCPE